MTYATLTDAIAAGADQNDPTLAAALVAADERVERYTAQVFTPDVVDRTITCRVLSGGRVSSPYVRSVTSVTVEGSDTVIPDTGWRLDLGVIRLRTFGSDALVVGAEPWNGGWANLLGVGEVERCSVVGKFGLDEVPWEVKRAAALITATLVPAAYVPQADAEGNPAGVAPAAGAPGSQQTPPPEMVAAAARLDRTTGCAEADRLLDALARSGGWKVG